MARQIGRLQGLDHLGNISRGPCANANDGSGARSVSGGSSDRKGKCEGNVPSVPFL